MSGSRKIRTWMPRPRLANLVRRPGGKSRRDAVSDALERVEALRDVSLAAVADAIESIALVASEQPLSDENIRIVTDLAQRIANLAGTFGLSALGKASANLCLVLESMAENNMKDALLIQVHVDAMRLFSPKLPEALTAEADRVLNELTNVLKHVMSLRAKADAR